MKDNKGQDMPDRKLLILDDDPAIGRTIVFIAEGMGVSARHTTSHEEFFQAHREWHPTHLAIDLVMPEMDGVQVLAQLAQEDCDSRIIITSGLGDRVLAAAARSAQEHGLDIVGVLSKPFFPVILRTMLAKNSPGNAKRDDTRAKPSTTAARPNLVVIEEEFARALKTSEFCVYYQPKVNCATLGLIGFEALVRWVHPVYGVICPDRFIPFAEAHGMIDALTDLIVDESLAWFAKWSVTPADAKVQFGTTDAVSPVSLSINLSAKLFSDVSFVERIYEKCRANGVDPARVIFELTESSAMDDPMQSLELLTRLRLKGFQLSIDDFGTGFSSMLQLARLPFSEIKVDKSFVMTAKASSESRAVIKSIVELGHSLGMSATAEGVEDADALEFLNAIGCDSGQGYLFARPMPASAIPEWLAGRFGSVTDS